MTRSFGKNFNYISMLPVIDMINHENTYLFFELTENEKKDVE